MISSTDRYVYYVGKTVGGTMHDYQAFKHEFDRDLGLLEAYEVLADLGYLGLTTDYGPASITLPHRKPRRSKAQPDTVLSEEQKQVNRPRLDEGGTLDWGQQTIRCGESDIS